MLEMDYEKDNRRLEFINDAKRELQRANMKRKHEEYVSEQVNREQKHLFNVSNQELDE
jgi:hypothetical protein